MGFLSSNAAKAFKQGRRRAYVPEWFQPLSYVVGGVAALALVVGLVTYDSAGPDVPAAGTATPTLPVATDTPGTDTPGSTDAPTTPSTGPSTTPGTETTQSVAGPDGAPVDVPLAALTAAQTITRALFTGDFTGVLVYPGQPTPAIVRTWPAPVIGDVAVAEEFADGTWRFSVVADPDGEGPEMPRQVPLFVSPTDEGWAFLPG